MFRAFDNAPAMPGRKSTSAPVVQTFAYRLYSATGLRFDVLAPSEEAARLHVKRRNPGVTIKRAFLAVDDHATASDRKVS